MCRVNVRVENGGQQHAMKSAAPGLAARAGLQDGIRLEVHGGFHAPPKPLMPTVEQ